MAATGASPTYYDFDAFQEMTINTGGVDVTQQTGGVGINLVTKSGTDRFKGSGRFYDTNDRFESNNITDGDAHAGRDAPATRSRTSRTSASRWAARSRRAAPGSGAATASSDINVGVLGFYKPDANCQAIKAAPLDLQTSRTSTTA